MDYFKACCLPGKLALGISEVFGGPAPNFGSLVLFTELSRDFPKSLGSPMNAILLVASVLLF